MDMIADEEIILSNTGGDVFTQAPFSRFPYVKMFNEALKNLFLWPEGCKYTNGIIVYDSWDEKGELSPGHWIVEVPDLNPFKSENYPLVSSPWSAIKDSDSSRLLVTDMTRLSMASLDGLGFSSSRDTDEQCVDRYIQDVWKLEQWHFWYCILFASENVPEPFDVCTTEEWYEWYSQWSDDEWYMWCRQKGINWISFDDATSR